MPGRSASQTGFRVPSIIDAGAATAGSRCGFRATSYTSGPEWVTTAVRTGQSDIDLWRTRTAGNATSYAMQPSYMRDWLSIILVFLS